MRMLALLSLGAPGLIGGYMLLTGYLLSRIRPIPITFVPDAKPQPFVAPAVEDEEELQAVAV